MNQHMKWVCAAALLLSPLAASAQSQPPRAAQGATPPAVAPAPPAGDDDGSWLADLFEGAPGEAPPALGDAEGHEGGLMAFDDDGPDGPHGPKRAHRMELGGPHGHGMKMRRNLGMRFAALDLTAAQREKLRDIHEASARKNVQRRADMQLAHMDLRKLMRAESPSASAVNGQIDRIARLQADGMKAHFDTFMQARAVLTPEQQKQLRSEPAPMRMEHERHGED
jgi:Spy/CpxP family protein refolding chaperone